MLLINGKGYSNLITQEGFQNFSIVVNESNPVITRIFYLLMAS